MEKRINTVEKGDDFESRSLDIVKRLLHDSQISHLPDQVRIYNRKEKGYYSAMRKKDIFFDLTIEVWPPGAERYSLIYFIECKNYDKSVPVDDLEEFHKKIEQVSGVHAKGIIISNAPLQEGAYNYADSAGMMVVQGETSEDYKIVLHKTNRDISGNNIPLLNRDLTGNALDSGIALIEQIIDENILKSFTQEISDTHVSYNINRLSKNDIQNIAEEELKKIDPLIFTRGKTINSNKLKKYLQEEFEINITSYAKPVDLLGFCDLRNSQIGLNQSIVGTSRELFILSHEFGHFKLHQKLKIGQIAYENFEDSQYNFKTRKHDLANPKNWIEWQANYFASSLVLPEIPFRARLVWCQQRLHLSEGKIYLDDQYQNRKDFSKLVEKMAYLFSTSKTSIIYRLNELKLINNQSRLKSISQIFEDYIEELMV